MAKENKKFGPKVDDLDGKVQIEDQAGASDMSAKLEAPKQPDSEIKDVEEPKTAINTKKAAEVVAAGSGPTGSSGLAFRGAVTFSGGAGGIKDDMSATTKENNPYRSGTRSGKRDDPITRKIDELGIEQFKTKINQSKALYEDPDGVGYNGNYYNEHVITQKRSGGSPADPNFERSVDLIATDLLVYASGQFVSPKSEEYLVINNWDPSASSGAGAYEDVPLNIPLGDYVPRNLHIEIGYDGRIQEFYLDCDEISPKNVDEGTYRMAGDARLRDYNQVELDRHIMISKAGNESDPSWSPLGDVITDPTNQNYFLKELDCIAGDMIGVSKRKLTQALAYQINKTAKDGKRRVGPMAEMSNYCVEGVGMGFHATAGAVTDTFYNRDILRNGGAGLFIALNDSLPKYTTKGKMLSLPLSYKDAVKIADSNMAPFRCHKQLFDLLKSNELFSNVDGVYDPLKPIIATDGIAVAHRINPFIGFSAHRSVNTSDVLNFTAATAYDKGDIVKVGATDFSTSVDYAEGDLVIYNSKMYIATQTHSHGAWNADHFTTYTPRYNGQTATIMVMKADRAANMVINVDNVTFLHSIDDYDPIMHDTIYIMHYENLRNKYNINIQNFFAIGLYRWFNERTARILDHFRSNRMDHPIGNGDGVTLNIPVVSTMLGISLWDLIVCASTPYMVECRLNTLTELLKYEENFGYPYTGTESLGSTDITACDNFTCISIDAPISAGAPKATAINRVKFPELFWPIAKASGVNINNHAGVVAKVVLPSYFVQNQFCYDDATDVEHRRLRLSDDYATVAYPSERSGNTLADLDAIYGIDENVWRLSLDRMVVYPGYEGNRANNFKTKWGCYVDDGDVCKHQALTYKYGLVTDGIPVIPYFAYATSAENKSDTLTVFDILNTPRELGLICIPPAGIASPTKDNSGYNKYISVASSYLGVSGPAFKAIMYHASGAVQHDILQPGDMNMNNNDASFADFSMISATPYDAQFDNGFCFNAKTGNQSLSPIVSGSYNEGVWDYDPDTGVYGEHTETQETGFNLQSNHKYLWTRLQRLPFVLNPFDVSVDALTTATETFTMINDCDIYSFLIIFGLCGFRASDYREKVNQRSKMRIAKGMNYVQDPFMDGSGLY